MSVRASKLLSTTRLNLDHLILRIRTQHHHTHLTLLHHSPLTLTLPHPPRMELLLSARLTLLRHPCRLTPLLHPCRLTRILRMPPSRFHPPRTVPHLSAAAAAITVLQLPSTVLQPTRSARSVHQHQCIMLQLRLAATMPQLHPVATTHQLQFTPLLDQCTESPITTKSCHRNEKKI